MPRFRLSAPARADLASILETSASRWGDKGRQRYARLLAAAMRTIAADPETPLSQERNELHRGTRSFHVRHARGPSGPRVKSPVHVLFFRVAEPGLIEIVRVLHENMDPVLQLKRR